MLFVPSSVKMQGLATPGSKEGYPKDALLRYMSSQNAESSCSHALSIQRLRSHNHAFDTHNSRGADTSQWLQYRHSSVL
ncbi:hypothetical protein ACRRTK_009767 [Alexandromys fortis]